MKVTHSSLGIDSHISYPQIDKKAHYYYKIFQSLIAFCTIANNMKHCFTTAILLTCIFTNKVSGNFPTY